MNITRMLINEIKEDCLKCGGMGQCFVPPPARTAPGEGLSPARRAHCWDCGGRGWVLSEWGDLLADVFRVVLADELAAKDHTHEIR